MPLTTTEKTGLQAKVAEVTALVEALVVDPPVNPLQAQLDAMTAERDKAIGERDAARAKLLQIIAVAQG